MTDPLEYLTQRFDQPRAITGAVIAYPEYGLGGALASAVTIGAAAAAFGGLIGSAIWLCLHRIGGADRLVRRPDLWGIPFRCTGCGWHTSPEGPWRLRDSLHWPECCPECSAPLLFQPPSCPRCTTPTMRGETTAQRMASLVRVPRSFRAGLWGDVTCRECGCDYDKWGRERFTP